MKALSIRQPWAYLIVSGYPVERDGKRYVWHKDIENRSWPLPKNFKLPQRIQVHAPARMDGEALDWMMEQEFSVATSLMLQSRLLPRGAIVGEVTITGCVTASDSVWFTGPYGFVLENPEAYAEPIAYKGRLGFFAVEEDRGGLHDDHQ